MLRPYGNRYELTEPLHYKDVVVPEGYKTDGLSYKIRFLGAFLSRYDPRFIKAAIVHDYMFDQGMYDKANIYFEELLPDVWQKPLMVAAVKMYSAIVLK